MGGGHCPRHNWAVGVEGAFMSSFEIVYVLP